MIDIRRSLISKNIKYNNRISLKKTNRINPDIKSLTQASHRSVNHPIKKHQDKKIRISYTKMKTLKQEAAKKAVITLK